MAFNMFFIVSSCNYYAQCHPSPVASQLWSLRSSACLLRSGWELPRLDPEKRRKSWENIGTSWENIGTSGENIGNHGKT